MQIITFPEPLELESGQALPELRIAYHSWGNPKADRVIWVFHALTANSDVSEWWPGLFGPGKLLDPNDSYVVCANMIGSCYGSTGPSDLPDGRSFPIVTIRDMVAAHRRLADHLGIERIHLGIGGSMGGQQLLEWSVAEPGRFDFIVPLATNARHSPWGIAFNEAQRMAIEAGMAAGDEGAQRGLEAARAIALLSYRHYHAYRQTQSEEQDDKITEFKASSYQRYQGLKLRRRFEVDSYLVLSRAMDSHNLGRGRGGVERALNAIQARTLVIGIDSDMLFPLEEQIELVQKIPDSRLFVIESTFGHDGFLVELPLIGQIVQAFLAGEVATSPILANSLGRRFGGIALPGSESF